MKSLFSINDYLEYIHEQIELNNESYGYKSKLANAAGCQRSFFTLVLAGRVHLTPDHAIKLSIFWKHRPLEQEYFFNLVLWARSGDKHLKKFLSDKLAEIRLDNENFTKRIPEASVLQTTEAAIYYSSWQYVAIHILLTIPEYRTPKAIATRLMLTEEFATKTLEALETMGLAQKNKNTWNTTEKSLHIPKNSPFVTTNHTNWRSRAMLNSYLNYPDDIHYTSVISISQKDSLRIKHAVLNFVEECRKIVGPSPEEDLYSLNCDFFKV